MTENQFLKSERLGLNAARLQELEEKQYLKSMLIKRLDEHTVKLQSLYIVSNQQLTDRQKYSYALVFEQLKGKIDEIAYVLNLLSDQSLHTAMLDNQRFILK